MEILRLASLAHLHPLSFEQLGALAPCARERRLAPGERLLLAGPLNQELVMIGSGRAVVRCAGEQVVELGPGDAFGALAPQRRSAYATARVIALTELDLVVFSSGDLRRIAQAAPDAVAALQWACSIDPADRAKIQPGDRPAPQVTLVPAAVA